MEGNSKGHSIEEDFMCRDFHFGNHWQCLWLLEGTSLMFGEVTLWQEWHSIEGEGKERCSESPWWAEKAINSTSIRGFSWKHGGGDGWACSGVFFPSRRLHSTATSSTACWPEVPILPSWLLWILHSATHGHVYFPSPDSPQPSEKHQTILGIWASIGLTDDCAIHSFYFEN